MRTSASRQVQIKFDDILNLKIGAADLADIRDGAGSVADINIEMLI
ncbi:MAG: hypothetical protein ABJN26_17295 [Stappiaceae bacterium]